MKMMEVDFDDKTTKVNSSTPPVPPQSPPRKPGGEVMESVTKQEIAKYWKRKRMVEEDHFNAAIKAAARLRAQNLSEEDYLCFLKFVEVDENGKEDATITGASAFLIDQDKIEIRVGIKNWWTKSKYAYLNQPAIKSMDIIPKQPPVSTYIPQFYCYKPIPPPIITTFGIC